MGLTDKGFQRRTYAEILEAKIQRAKELFGEDIDTSDQSVLGKYLRINAYDQAVAEEEIEQVYYARFPNTASGQSLDRLCVFAGITRNPATPAVYMVKIAGTAGHTVPAGFLVASDTGITYWTAEDCTITEFGTALVLVHCTEAGTIGNLSSPSAICRVANPDMNIDSVQGMIFTTPGVDVESDADLRKRFAAALTSGGSGSEDAIRSAIMRVPTVQYATVISNNTNAEDAKGRPPHSFEAYVLGGDGYEQEIAQAIFDKRPVGIQTAGDKAVTVTDACGNERTIRYSPAVKVPVIVRIKLTATPVFPSDGVVQIQAGVANHINSLGIGQRLVYSSLYGCIYGVPGVQEVTDLWLSTDGGTTYGQGSVNVFEYGIVVCERVDVEVTS